MNKELIKKLNESLTKVFIAATGGGSSFIGDYLKIPGGSATILGFYVPYSQELFNEFIGGKPDKYVSSEAARKLAVESYNKARNLGCTMGVGVSCSLTTGEGEREGRENWVHIAVHGANFTSRYDTRIDQMFETRGAQEIFVAKTMLDIIAYESGLLPDFIKWEGEFYERYKNDSDVSEVMNADYPKMVHTYFNELNSAKSIGVLCGSFNPIHEAHEKMAALTSQYTEAFVTLELCVKNVDKAGLDYFDLKDRLNPISPKYPVVVTNTPLFIDKIALFREYFTKQELIIVMGKDTWNRFLHPSYDKNIPEIIERLKWANVKFLVFGRNGDFFDKNHPAEQWRIQDKRVENFDVKLSSREIRAGQLAKT